jgi:O-antigen/teichoic acid export membrane protein
MLEKIKGFLFKNKNTRQTVAKNTFWLTVSNFGGRIIKAAVIIYAARALGTAEYGIFSYAITLAGFMTLFMDPGINTVLMRESAKSSENERSEFFSTIFVIKILLLIGGVSIIIFIGPYFSTLPGTAALLPIVAFVLMFDTLREFFMSLLRSMEKMEWEAAVFIFTNLAIVAFGFFFILRNPTAESLGWGYAIGTMLGALAAVILLRKYVRQITTHFKRKLIAPIVQAAWPFAVVGVLGLFLTNTDILIISWIKTASDVGIYSAAIRVIQMLYLVPGIIQLSILPLFSRLAKTDNARFRIALERSISLIFLISIPIAVGGVILGTQILSFIFGSAFAPGGMAFKLLLITLIVDFPGSIIVNAIFAYGHQRSLIITSAIGAISNVILDVILIPRFGMTGSAFGTLIAQTLSNGYLWYVMNKINPFSIPPHLKKILAATLVMALVTVALFFLHVELLIIIALSTLTYFAILLALREKLLTEINAVLPFSKSVPLSEV